MTFMSFGQLGSRSTKAARRRNECQVVIAQESEYVIRSVLQRRLLGLCNMRVAFEAILVSR